MRTNIVLDDELVARAKEVTGLATKRGVVEEALRTLIRLREQEQVRRLRGKLSWQGDLADSRKARFGSAG